MKIPVTPVIGTRAGNLRKSLFSPIIMPYHTETLHIKSLRCIRREQEKNAALLERNENVDGVSRVSIAEAIGKFVFICVGLVVALALYIVLGERPFGIQIATLIAYTGGVFCLVFFRWRWLHEAYSLRKKEVQQQIPRLLAIHAAFLAFLFAVLTFAFFVRPHLPSYWLIERGVKHDSLFSDGLILICSLTGVTQVFISRSILSRSVRDENTTST